MKTIEQFENIRKELKFLKEELTNINSHCNERLTKIEDYNTSVFETNNTFSLQREVNMNLK